MAVSSNVPLVSCPGGQTQYGVAAVLVPQQVEKKPIEIRYEYLDHWYLNDWCSFPTNSGVNRQPTCTGGLAVRCVVGRMAEQGNYRLALATDRLNTYLGTRCRRRRSYFGSW
jgi:hypothetical protein